MLVFSPHVLLAWTEGFPVNLKEGFAVCSLHFFDRLYLCLLSAAVDLNQCWESLLSSVTSYSSLTTQLKND